MGLDGMRRGPSSRGTPWSPRVSSPGCGAAEAVLPREVADDRAGLHQVQPVDDQQRHLRAPGTIMAE